MQAAFYGRLRGWGGAVLQVVLGVIFIAHGAQQLIGEGLGGVAVTMGGLGMPALVAVVLGLVELRGGVALILGLFTRLAAAGTSALNPRPESR